MLALPVKSMLRGLLVHGLSLSQVGFFFPHNDADRSHQSFFKTIIQIELIMLFTLTELIPAWQNSRTMILVVLRN